MSGSTLLDRLVSKIDVAAEPDACWAWTASTDGYGYGHIGAGGRHGKMLRAHRAVYELFVEPVPDGMELDHTCHDKDICPGGPTCPHRRCCNPDHLDVVTHQVNVDRSNAGQNMAAKTHCPQEHAYEGDNLYITPSGGRSCRTCKREQIRAYKQRNRDKVRDYQREYNRSYWLRRKGDSA